MALKSHTTQLSQILGAVPTNLREALLEEFNKLVRNFREGRWEPAELDGGKFCEVAYQILIGAISGKYPTTISKPENFLSACRALEQGPATVNRALRIQVPRVLVAVYEIRNNRGVGHVGGDVSPNHMDSSAVVMMVKWVVAEFVRIFHQVSTEEAVKIVDTLVEREIPLVWKVDGKVRVLDPSLSKKDQTLLALYSISGGISDSDLIEWVEHSNASIYKRDILRPLHKSRLIEYDEERKFVTLSPTGILYVETKLLPP